MYSYEFTKEIGGKTITEKFETDDKNLGVELALKFFRKIFTHELEIKISSSKKQNENTEDEFTGGTGENY